MYPLLWILSVRVKCNGFNQCTNDLLNESTFQYVYAMKVNILIIMIIFTCM